MANAVTAPGGPATQDELEAEASNSADKQTSVLPLVPRASAERPGPLLAPDPLQQRHAPDPLQQRPGGPNDRLMEAYTNAPIIEPASDNDNDDGDLGGLADVLMRRTGLDPLIMTGDGFSIDVDPSDSFARRRMPTPDRNFFAASVAQEIDDGLKTIARRPGAAGLAAGQVKNAASTGILLIRDPVPGREHEADPKTDVWQRHPDAQFQHAAAAFPGVVLEVSDSTEEKDLEKLAHDYIQCSNGFVKVVIGIQIHYRDGPSTISIWRRKFKLRGGQVEALEIEQAVANQPFRSPVGEPLNRDEKIRLTLNDFLTDELLQPPGPVELNIAYITITDLLDLALEMQKTRAQIPPGCARAKRRIKRRRRPVELARTT